MTGLYVALILAALSGVASLWRVRQSRQLTRQLNAGTARVLRCWLRGGAAPYPGALNPGRLVAAEDGSVRFESRTGTVRRLLLPAGGLRVMQSREATEADRLAPLVPTRPDQFSVLVCRDTDGVRVDVAVPVEAAASAESFLLGTVTATGPETATDLRPVGRIRRLVGGWTVLVLVASVLVLGLSLWPWRDAQRVTATLDAVGGSCVFKWSDPWTAEPRYTRLSCPDRPERGQQIEFLARPGQDPSTTGEPYLGLIYAGTVALLALPQLARRTSLHLRGRAAHRRPDRRPDLAGWRSSPRLEAGELDPASVSEVATVRADLEGWREQSGRPARQTVRPSTPRPWWRIRFLRRRLLTPTTLGSIAFLFLLAGLVLGVPLWQTASALADGPVRQTTATVEPHSPGTRAPFVPVSVPVFFVEPDGRLVETRVASDGPLPVLSSVEVRYLVDDPRQARLVGEHDHLVPGVVATTVVAGLAVAVWIGNWVVAVHRVRRLAAALADPDPGRMRYVLVTDPRGRLSALLYPTRGTSDAPTLVQPLAGGMPREAAVSGVADLHDAGRYGHLLVVGDVVLWPSGRTRPATAGYALSLVNGRL